MTSKIIESSQLNKLKVFKIISIKDNKFEVFEPFIRKYGMSLKVLAISLLECSSDGLKTCFGHISRFESLESLQFPDISDTNTEAIEQCLKLLANKCTKVREIVFKTDFYTSNR